MVAAQKDGQKIAVEIKSFIGPSKISQFYTALGQFISYRAALQQQESDRILYLAVPSHVYDSFFTMGFIQSLIQQNQIHLIVYDIEQRGDGTMANVDLYRQHIQNLLSQHASLVWDERIQAQTIFDTERDHYQLVYVGWRNQRRIYGPVLHLQIMDNKIWIQQDGTEVGIANELVELGVPKQDIILGFDPPNMRQLSDFAIG